MNLTDMSDPLKKLQQLQDELHKFRLTHEEKSDMRGELVRFMNEHPAKEAEGNFVSPSRAGRHIERTRPFGWFVPFLTLRPMPALLALLLVVFTGGGVSLAANNALPGDLLYPVKVSVNEEVHSAFTFSPAAEMEWEISRSERRLVEAERLEADGRLKSKAAIQLAAQVERHDKTIAELETELQSRGEDVLVADLRSQYEARLLAYESLLYQVLSDSRVVAVVENGRQKTEVRIEEEGTEVDVTSDATVAINIRLPDLIRELRQEGEGDETFRDEAAYSRDKAKMVLNRTEELMKTFVSVAEDQTPFERALEKLYDARAFYDKGVVEFYAGRFAAAYAHFNNSITFSNQAENMANQIMADIEREDTLETSQTSLNIDFAITAITLPEGILTVTQANLGDASYNALDGHTYIWIDDMRLPKWTYSWATLSNPNRLFLNAFSSSLLQPQSLKGKHTVKACIDALNVVKELNESNNCMTQVVAVTAPTIAPTEQQPVRHFQEILPGDEQYASKAKTLRSELENELSRFEQLVERYVAQWGQDDLIQTIQNLAESARIAFMDGDRLLESRNYYWAYVNFNEGLRFIGEAGAEYNALVGSRTDTRVDDPADREMAPALDAHAKAIAKLKDARECLAIAEAQPYLDQAEAAFSKADAQFERQEYSSATENYLDAYNYAGTAYDLCQKIKAADKSEQELTTILDGR